MQGGHSGAAAAQLVANQPNMQVMHSIAHGLELFIKGAIKEVSDEKKFW